MQFQNRFRMKRTIHWVVCIMLSAVPFFCVTEGMAQKIGYVEPRQWAVVYAGIPTPVEVHTDAKTENVTLTVSAGRVEKGENNTYYLYMPDSMQGKTVTVSILNKKSGEEIGSSKFRIYKVPDPMPFVAGTISRAGFQTPSELLSFPKLRAINLGDFIYGIKWEVIAFRINIISNGVSVVDQICLGDSIPQDIQKIIKTVPTYSSVTFRNIVASSTVGTRMLPEFTIFIMEEGDEIIDPFDDTIDDPDLSFEEEPVVLFTEVEPQFPDGTDAMNKYLVKNIKVPEHARNMGVNGTVFVEFIVEKDGSITEPKLKNSLHPLCDKEVLRVVQEMPKWRPGLNMGKPVRCRYMIPVEFRIQ